MLQVNAEWPAAGRAQINGDTSQERQKRMLRRTAEASAAHPRAPLSTSVESRAVKVCAHGGGGELAIATSRHHKHAAGRKRTQAQSLGVNVVPGGAGRRQDGPKKLSAAAQRPLMAERNASLHACWIVATLTHEGDSVTALMSLSFPDPKTPFNFLHLR